MVGSNVCFRWRSWTFESKPTRGGPRAPFAGRVGLEEVVAATPKAEARRCININIEGTWQSLKGRSVFIKKTSRAAHTRRLV